MYKLCIYKCVCLCISEMNLRKDINETTTFVSS